MYDLDKNTDTTPLIGKVLIQICVGLYQLIMNFDNDLTISVESQLIYRYDGNEVIIDSYPEKCHCLMTLIGKKIQNAAIRDKQSLVLVFNGKEELEVIDSNEEFESFQVTGQDIDIIA